MIRVVLIRTGEKPEVREIDGSLGSMQALVNGDIEMHHMGGNFQLVCNEDGMALGLPQNSCGILGDYFITKCDAEGNAVSLTDQDVEIVKAWWATYRTVRHRGTLPEVRGFSSLEEMKAWKREQEFNARHAN
jgi:hypothetical protein